MFIRTHSFYIIRSATDIGAFFDAPGTISDTGDTVMEKDKGTARKGLPFYQRDRHSCVYP